MVAVAPHQRKSPPKRAGRRDSSTGSSPRRKKARRSGPVRCPDPAGRLCLALMERSRLLRVTSRQDVFTAECQSPVPCLWHDPSPQAPQANRAIGQSVLPQAALPLRKGRLRLAGRDQDADVEQELKPPSTRLVGPRVGAHHRMHPFGLPRPLDRRRAQGIHLVGRLRRAMRESVTLCMLDPTATRAGHPRGQIRR